MTFRTAAFYFSSGALVGGIAALCCTWHCPTRRYDLVNPPPAPYFAPAPPQPPAWPIDPRLLAPPAMLETTR